MHRTLATAAAIAALPVLPALAQDVDPGLAYNNNCRTCHSRDEGDNRLGPNLYQIVGRDAAAAEGYQYSNALASADFAWDEERLDAWIENPDNVLNGHKMKPYSGIAEAETRAAIIEALKTDD
ncbi:c-type cytochrome [Roseivivax sediminis]|uniref:Cytochrome c n=1 Tax=Roseivivax sediminis TaxID=936889 RepID=A0A1I1WGX5_9RHOB|nr:c-type cytochrome [Roseivivax sediminis]SFD94416.1 cytochrome c [Roseivivax sediminis]